MIKSVIRPRLSALLDPQFSAQRLVKEGLSEQEAATKGLRFARAAQSLISRGCDSELEAVAVFVPGRIEVLGKHTDYCGGRSLLCTVERGMCFVAVPRQDPVVVFHAIDMDDSVTMQLSRDLEPSKRHWSNYAMTVARRVARNFPTANLGADIAMSSDLPAASGLSSSSAMIVGCFLVLSGINQLAGSNAYQENIKTPEDLAGYLGCVENGQNFRALSGDKGVGTFGGSQDHTAILCCKPNTLSLYSFCPVEHHRDIPLQSGLCFVIAASGVIAEKTGEALEKYNQVSATARKLVATWNHSTQSNYGCLREVVWSRSEAASELGQMVSHDLLLVSRLNQFVAESERIIPAAVDALAAHDWESLRALVNASQTGAENDLHNQVFKTIDLQRRLLDYGALAASAFGAGFGGSVWGLFRNQDVEQALAKLPSAFVTRPGCAAVEILDA